MKPHLTAGLVSAAAVLLASGMYYQKRKEQLSLRLSRSGTAVASFPETGQVMIPAAGSDNGQADSGPLPETLPEIIAALRGIAEKPFHPTNRFRLLALLRRIPPEQYQEFYSTADPLIPEPGWSRVVAASIEIWRTVDIAALNMALFETDNAKRTELRIAALTGNVSLKLLWMVNKGSNSRHQQLFREWVHHDLPAAARWLKSRKDTPLMRLPFDDECTLHEDYAKVLTELISKDADTADAWIRGSGPPMPEVLYAWAQARNPYDEETDVSRKPVAEVFAGHWKPEEIRMLGHEVAIATPDILQEWIRGGALDPAGRFQAALGLVMVVESNTGSRRSTRRRVPVEPPERLERAAFALEYADSIPRDQALRAITESWLERGRNGLPELRGWLMTMTAGAPEESGPALETGARILARSPDTMAEAMAFAAGISDDPARARLQRGIFLRWRDADPRAAAEFLNTAPPEALASEIARHPQWLDGAPAEKSDNQPVSPAVAFIRSADPEATAREMLENAPPEQRGEVIQGLVHLWAEDDLNAAGVWLSSLPEDPDKWKAVRTFALAAVGDDPAAALQWAASIGEAAGRGTACRQVFTRCADADPAAAAAWLPQSGWSGSQLRDAEDILASGRPTKP